MQTKHLIITSDDKSSSINYCKTYGKRIWDNTQITNESILDLNCVDCLRKLRKYYSDLISSHKLHVDELYLLQDAVDNSIMNNNMRLICGE